MPAVTELWTLYAFGVAFTCLRTYARISAVGIRDLRADDYLIWFAVLIYTAQCVLGHKVGSMARGLANNGMTDEQRSMLSPDDPEYDFRVIGSKIQVAGWTTAACLLWTLKLSLSFFYLRLHNGLHSYIKRIYITMGIILATWAAVICTIYLSCRPFHHYWQISPDPGNQCQAAVSRPIIWVSFICNISTDILLLMIPLPMLWQSTLKLLKKVAASLVLSAGVLIIICAILKTVYVLVDPVMGGRLAAEWGTRETFVAVVTTNLPMIFPLLKTWVLPLFPSRFRTTSADKKYKTPSGFITIGGGGGGSRGISKQSSTHHITANMTYDNDSEEHIIESDGEHKMKTLHPTRARKGSLNGIVIERELKVTMDASASEDGRSEGSQGGRGVPQGF